MYAIRSYYVNQMKSRMKSIVILISGRGSNMQSLLAAAADGSLPVRVAAVLSNRPGAAGLETAVSIKRGD